MPLDRNYNLDDESDRLKLIDEYWQQAKDGLEEENQRFAENFRFYCGGDGQWDEEALAILDEEGRPHLSVNKCLSSLNVLSGYQRKFRDALTVFPRRDGTQNASRILTELGRHTMESGRPNGDLCMSEMFLMAMIGGKWWAGWRDDFVHDPIYGDIAPEVVSYADVWEDPLYRGYDIDENNPYNFCRFLFRNWHMTPEMVKILWPDKKEEVSWFNNKATDGKNSEYILHGVTNDYKYGSDYSKAYSGTSGNTNIMRYQIRRCYHKDWVTKNVLFNRVSGEKIEITDNLEKVKQIAEQSDILELFFHTAPVMHQTTFMGQVELDHIVDPFNGITNYPLTRFCPYFVDGYAMGVIDNLKDPQRELNKSRSQVLANLNQSNNSGWIAPEGCMVDPDNYERSATPGWVGTYLPAKGKPEKLVPTPPSQGHIVMAQMAESDFDKITNINDAVTGMNGQKESGEALKTRRDQGLTTSEVIFDNFNQSQVALYQNLTERLRTPNKNGTMLYSPEEIQQIVQEHDLPMDEETMQAMQKGRYGMRVGRSQTQVTARTENFDKLLGLLEKVPQAAQEIDILDILDASDISGKDKLIQSVQSRRMQMLQQAMAQQQQALQMGAVG